MEPYSQQRREVERMIALAVNPLKKEISELRAEVRRLKGIIPDEPMRLTMGDALKAMATRQNYPPR